MHKNRRRTSIHSEHEKGITELSIYGKFHKEYQKPTLKQTHLFWSLKAPGNTFGIAR